MKNYQGSNYQDDRPIKEIAQLIKKEFNKDGVKLSITTSKKYGNMSINIDEVPFCAYTNRYMEYSKLEINDGFHNWIETIESVNYNDCTEYMFTEQYIELFHKIGDFVQSYNYDNSEIESDYFDVGFYFNINHHVPVKDQIEKYYQEGLTSNTKSFMKLLESLNEPNEILVEVEMYKPASLELRLTDESAERFINEFVKPEESEVIDQMLKEIEKRNQEIEKLDREMVDIEAMMVLDDADLNDLQNQVNEKYNECLLLKKEIKMLQSGDESILKKIEINNKSILTSISNTI